MNPYVLKTKSIMPITIDSIRTNSAAMMLTLLDFSKCLPELELLSSLPSFIVDELSSRDHGVNVSQKELADNVMGSPSGSKIVDVTVGGSIDNNSTQWSLRTYKT